MMRAHLALLASVALLAVAYAQTPLYSQLTPYAAPEGDANNFVFTKPEFEVEILEATERTEDNYTGFVFGFNNAAASDATPNGMLQLNQVNTNPFLSTLPGDGNGQTIVTLGPCASNTAHVHPRGSEISFMLYGSIQFGMVEENANKNGLVLRNITQNETIHIPQGLLHFSFNPNCYPAAFLANFATSDPGTQTIWNSLMMMPNNFLYASTGINEGNWTNIKQAYPLMTPPGTGGTECLQRCGIDFTAANKFTAVTNPSYSTSGASATATAG